MQRSGVEKQELGDLSDEIYAKATLGNTQKVQYGVR